METAGINYSTGDIMPAGNRLEHVSIVLVDTKTPANIGAVARCMMNMGLSRLVLVDPPKDRNGDARRLAAGAEAILDKAAVFDSLRQAVADQNMVIGTSRHQNRRRRNVRTPRETAEEVIPLLDRNRVCFVFGNEVNGLEQDHLALCHEQVYIPSSPDFPSLNLSHAVLIIIYELFLASGNSRLVQVRELAREDQLEAFYVQLQRTLENIGFLDRAHPDLMMSSLRQVFGRSRIDPRELSIFRGIMTEVERARNKNEI